MKKLFLLAGLIVGLIGIQTNTFAKSLEDLDGYDELRDWRVFMTVKKVVV